MDKELELIYNFVEDNKSFVAENPVLQSFSMI